MEYILSNSLAALLECENVSLLGVNRLLTDGRYRALILFLRCAPLVPPAFALSAFLATLVRRRVLAMLLAAGCLVQHCVVE